MLLFSQKWIGNWNAKLKKKRAGSVSGEGGPMPKKTVRERKVTPRNIFYGKLAREGTVHQTHFHLLIKHHILNDLSLQ